MKFLPNVNEINIILNETGIVEKYPKLAEIFPLYQKIIDNNLLKIGYFLLVVFSVIITYLIISKVLTFFLPLSFSSIISGASVLSTLLIFSIIGAYIHLNLYEDVTVTDLQEMVTNYNVLVVIMDNPELDNAEIVETIKEDMDNNKDTLFYIYSEDEIENYVDNISTALDITN